MIRINIKFPRRSRSIPLLAMAFLALQPMASQAEEAIKSADRLIRELSLTEQQLVLRRASGRRALPDSQLMSTEGSGKGDEMFPAESDVMGMIIEQPSDDFGRSDLTVGFEYNSAKLTPQARRQLTELARALESQELREFEFEVVGHTDAVGSNEYNQRLSEQRARSVQRYLANEHGVTEARLIPIGLGEEQLMLPDDPENGANRRVEVINIGRTLRAVRR